jgi:hypothetical protein
VGAHRCDSCEVRTASTYKAISVRGHDRIEPATFGALLKCFKIKKTPSLFYPFTPSVSVEQADAAVTLEAFVGTAAGLNPGRVTSCCFVCLCDGAVKEVKNTTYQIL